MSADDRVGSRLTAEQVAELQRTLESTSDEDGAVDLKSAPRGAGADPIVLRYDLLGGGANDTDQLPGLELIHERFSRELAGELRRMIGRDGHFIPQRLRLVKFAQVYAGLRVPTALIVVDFKGLGCSAIINMDPELMMHFLDLMMGGHGGRFEVSDDLAMRGFTAAERGLIKHLVHLFSRALRASWEDVTRVSLEVSRVATDPRHVALFSPGDLMIELPLAVEWEDVTGVIEIILPMSYLRPFEDALSRTATPDHLHAEGQMAAQLTESFMPIEVELTAVLGSTRVTLDRILALTVGDVIRLDRDPDQPVALLVEGVDKYEAAPTVQHGNLAVQILGPIDSASRRDREN